MRLLFSFLFIGLFFCSANAQTKLWDGGGGNNQWSTAANWVGDAVPGPSDNVLLDNSIVTINYTVELPNTSVTVKTLTIEPLAGSNQIFFVLPPTNTIANNAFVTTGNGTDYSITIASGGSFENHGTVSSGTNLSIADSIKIKTGANYFHRTQSSISGWIKRLSKAPGTEEGVFIFDVPTSNYSFSIDLDGLTFGNLSFASLSLPTGVAYHVSGLGLLEVKSNLNINVNTDLEFDMSGNAIVYKDVLMFNGSVFDLQTSSANNIVKFNGTLLYLDGTITKSGTGYPQLQLNGSSNQNITLTGSISNNVELNINKPSGNVTLSTPVTLPYKLTLTSGKIITTATNILTLADNATCSGGSTSSFVQGPMRKIGDDDFVFPIGLGTMYTPIGMSDASIGSATDVFTAEYKRSNPQSASLYGSGVGTGLNHVSYVEYWMLTQNTGASSKNVSLAVHAASFCKVLSNTYVCRWNGTIWNKETTNFSGLTDIGLYETGTITTANGLTGFTAPDDNVFTLGTDLNFIMNPLPVNLISFSARKMNDSKSLLEWELAECCSAAVKFEVERAEDNRVFKKIKTIGGSETDRFYSLTDENLQTGTNYYRLKITDENGFVMYSNTVTVINGSKALLMVLAPTVTSDQINLTFSSANNQRLDIYITDMQGRIVRSIRQQLPAGNSNLSVLVSDLNAGMYQVIGVTGNERTNTTRFIKQ